MLTKPNATPDSSPALDAPPARRRRTWVKATVSVVVLVAVAGSLTAWRASAAKKDEKKPAAEKVFEFTASDMARLEARQIGKVIPVSGSMRPVLFATVKSKQAAEVATVLVKEGEQVHAGQVLLTLDTRDLKARVDSAQAALAEAKARLSLASKNQDTNAQLLAKNFISQNAVDTTQNAVDVAQANVNNSQAQLDIAKRALEDTQVHAPFAGIVAKRMINPGEKVSPDTPLMQVVDLAQMEIETQVPVSEIPLVKLGQEISFKVDGFEGRSFNGVVGRINPAAEPGTRSISVYVTLPNPDQALKGGMFANGKVVVAGTAPVNALPAMAVREEGGQTFVYTLKDGQLDRKPVSLGRKNSDSDYVEIRDGLPPGTQVVAVKAEGLKQGAKASLKVAQAAASSPTPNASTTAKTDS
jgi:RND family efflux transporter MFP subunit